MGLPSSHRRRRAEPPRGHHEQLSTLLDEFVEATWPQILGLLRLHPELTSAASEALLDARITSAIRDSDDNERIALEQRRLIVRRWRAGGTANVDEHTSAIEFLFPDLSHLLDQALDS